MIDDGLIDKAKFGRLCGETKVGKITRGGKSTHIVVTTFQCLKDSNLNFSVSGGLISDAPITRWYFQDMG